MIIGYRCWEVVLVNDKPKLKSPHSVGRFYWEPGETTALCETCSAKAKTFSSKIDNIKSKLYGDIGILKTTSPEILNHIISIVKSEIDLHPDDFMDNCTCGLYALRTPEACVEQGYTQGILGEVALYGKVVIGEHAYRAEKAKVLNFYLPTFRRMPAEMIYELADTYQANLIKAEGALYNIICSKRSKDGLTSGALKYGLSPKSIANKAPTARYGKGEYWGEKEESYDKMDAYYNQIDSSIPVSNLNPVNSAINAMIGNQAVNPIAIKPIMTVSNSIRLAADNILASFRKNINK